MNVHILPGISKHPKVRSLVDNEIRLQLRSNIIKKVVNHVIKENDITIDQLNQKSRKQDIVCARQEIHYLLLDRYLKDDIMKYGQSKIYPEIFKICGEMDRISLYHSKKTISNLREVDKRFNEYIEDVINVIDNIVYWDKKK